MRRIVTWNIRQGGGSGDRQTRIIKTLFGFDADVLVLTEFRVGRSGAGLLQALRGNGYEVSHPPVEVSKNTVLIASRSAIRNTEPLNHAGADRRHLWKVDLGWLSAVGVYMPVGIAKLPYWDKVIQLAELGNAPGVFIGDFNTGANTLDRDPRGGRYSCPQYMEKIATSGFVDIWRQRYPNVREYTWFSPVVGNGFRLDHAFGSSKLNAAVTGCHYDHAPRLSGVSDHSALVAELEISPAAQYPGPRLLIARSTRRLPPVSPNSKPDRRTAAQ